MIEDLYLRHGIDADRVATRFYIGSRPPPGEALREAGFSALALCATTREYRRVAGYEPSGRTFPGVLVLHASLDDSYLDPETLRAAYRAGDMVASAHADGRRVLVTCWMGRNRSGLVLALALRRRFGWSGRRALRAIQAHREDALTNEHFASFLSELPPPGSLLLSGGGA